MKKFFIYDDGHPVSFGKDRNYSLKAFVGRSILKRDRNPVPQRPSERILNLLVWIVAFGGLAFIAGCLYYWIWVRVTGQT